MEGRNISSNPDAGAANNINAITTIAFTFIFHITWIVALIIVIKKISATSSIFQWIEVRYFKDPVIRLEQDRVENKYFPFKTDYSEDKDPIFRLTYRPIAFYGSRNCLIAATVCFVYSILNCWQQECTSVFGYAMIVSLVNTFRWMHELRLDIEQDGENYYYYVGNKLKYKGNVRDIYIRIRIEMCPNDETYYYLILHGYGIEEYVINKLSRDGKSLKRHGKRMSYKLNLNFFDYQDESNDHCIRHMCGLSDFALLSRAKRSEFQGVSMDLMTRMTNNINQNLLSKVHYNPNNILKDTFENVLTRNMTGMSPGELNSLNYGD